MENVKNATLNKRYYKYRKQNNQRATICHTAITRLPYSFDLDMEFESMSNCHCWSAFCLLFDILLSPWLFAYAVLFLISVLIVCVPFSFGALDRWNSIVWVPDHCLSLILRSDSPTIDQCLTFAGKTTNKLLCGGIARLFKDTQCLYYKFQTSGCTDQFLSAFYCPSTLTDLLNL